MHRNQSIAQRASALRDRIFMKIRHARLTAEQIAHRMRISIDQVNHVLHARINDVVLQHLLAVAEHLRIVTNMAV